MISAGRLLRLPRCLAGAGIALLALVSGPASSRCEVSVQGTAQAVRVHARKAPLAEVLQALAASFKVRHDAFIALDGMIITGTYSGELEDVLERVLAGLNYVIMTEDGTVEVIIVGRPGAPPAAVESPPKLPINRNPAAQWRRSAQQH